MDPLVTVTACASAALQGRSWLVLTPVPLTIASLLRANEWDASSVGFVGGPALLFLAPLSDGTGQLSLDVRACADFDMCVFQHKHSARLLISGHPAGSACSNTVRPRRFLLSRKITELTLVQNWPWGSEATVFHAPRFILPTVRSAIVRPAVNAAAWWERDLSQAALDVKFDVKPDEAGSPIPEPASACVAAAPAAPSIAVAPLTALTSAQEPLASSTSNWLGQCVVN
jgi:hypothetical protein